MEIVLLTEGTDVIRKIIQPVVQLDVFNGNVIVSGKDVVKMMNGEEFIGDMRQLCTLEPSYGVTEPTPEDDAKTARNAAKETAKQAYLTSQETALKKYVKACFDINNPQTA